MDSKEILILELWKEVKSLSDLSIRVFGYVNERKTTIIKEVAIKNNLDINELKNRVNESKRLYKSIVKECPICKTKFKTREGHKREKITCSHSCSNTFFRSGENNPNWKETSNGREPMYRKICFDNHKKECIICGEDKIVEVHHFDENHENDSIDNLIPLCPTHHRYWHSRYKNLVYDKVVEYRNNFIKNKI